MLLSSIRETTCGVAATSTRPHSRNLTLGRQATFCASTPLTIPLLQSTPFCEERRQHLHPPVQVSRSYFMGSSSWKLALELSQYLSSPTSRWASGFFGLRGKRNALHSPWTKVWTLENAVPARCGAQTIVRLEAACAFLTYNHALRLAISCYRLASQLGI